MIILQNFEGDQELIVQEGTDLLFSSIFTPPVIIWDVRNNEVNGIWKLPKGWAEVIQKKLDELSSFDYGNINLWHNF